MRLIRSAGVLAGVVMIAACSAHSQSGTGTLQERTSAPATSSAGRTTGHVTAVIDGDTLRVDVGGRQHDVRILGINSPEIAHPRYGKKSGQCGGQAARRYADHLLYRQTVALTTDPREAVTDRYGRWLRYVTVDGHDAGLELLQSGHAMEYHPRSAQAEQRRARYVAAQKTAQKKRVGQWATCRLDQVTKAPSGPR